MPDSIGVFAAKVGKTHALGGEVVLYCYVQDEIKSGTKFIVEPNEQGIDELILEAIRPFKNDYIAKFQGFDDLEQARSIVGRKLYLADLTDVQRGYSSYIGLEVIDQTGFNCGSVVDVIDNPASDLLELDTGVLVPIVFIKEVVENPYRCFIRVEIPEGLIDLN